MATTSVNPNKALWEKGDFTRISATMRHSGDKLVERVIEESAEYIGIGVANVINLLNPEMVVLGGGIIDALEDDMMAIIVETAKDYALAGTAKGIEIIPTKLGDDAGIVGGAVLARRETK